MNDSVPANVPGRIALAFAIVATVLGTALQVLPILGLLSAVTYDDAVAYPTAAAMYAAHYRPVVSFFVTAGIIHMVPSIAAVVFGVIGAKRPRPVAAAIALGVGALSVLGGFVGFALIPVIADAAGSASIGG